MTGPSAVRIALLYPELLGTYGDRGNALVLLSRLAWRGVPAELVEAPWGEPAPAACDIYVLGGGEDGPQAAAANALISEGALQQATGDGAAVLGICAGFQILGRSFIGPDGAPLPGLGLLDCVTARRATPRVVGEILVEPLQGGGPLPSGHPPAVPWGPQPHGDPDGGGPLPSGDLPEARFPPLSGYENHAGLTDLGPGATALGRVEAGVGNGDGTEGAVGGRVVGTYLHGPVLARNPALADLILSWFVGELDPLDDSGITDLREERRRFVAAEPARRPSRRRFGRLQRRRTMASIDAPSEANFSV